MFKKNDADELIEDIDQWFSRYQKPMDYPDFKKLLENNGWWEE